MEKYNLFRGVFITALFQTVWFGFIRKRVTRVSEQTYLYCYQNLSEFMFSQYGSSDEKVTWTSRDKVFLLSLIGTAYHSHGNSPRPSSCVSHVFVTRLVYARQLCKGGRVLKIGKREG